MRRRRPRRPVICLYRARCCICGYTHGAYTREQLEHDQVEHAKSAHPEKWYGTE